MIVLGHFKHSVINHVSIQSILSIQLSSSPAPLGGNDSLFGVCCSVYTKYILLYLEFPLNITFRRWTKNIFATDTEELKRRNCHIKLCDGRFASLWHERASFQRRRRAALLAICLKRQPIVKNYLARKPVISQTPCFCSVVFRSWEVSFEPKTCRLA